MSLTCEQIALMEQIGLGAARSVGKPNYFWGRAGANNNLQWLDNNGVPSNISGLPFKGPTGILFELWISNPELSDFNISLYRHEGKEVNLTLIKTVNILAADRTKIYEVSDLGEAVPGPVQLATRINGINSGNPKNTEVYSIVLATG